ncbi:hypothetical protein LX32DRAFT_713336 [Colletotrichum zoysiae]|uniref:Alcohol dehydrogenase-like N-terminal domain-containing protein n=1 Tax=Colletotrichum zoysiae TaxID=1216348 RepID=A0AAD9M2F2_9PEZI|nr:hypothetical protein LX32DRAFT_713336 [Colletotrichum zoysiae]
MKPAASSQTAVVQSKKGFPESALPFIVARSRPMPPDMPTPHHVLVRVEAVGLNPTDFKMTTHFFVEDNAVECDFCGTVVDAEPEARHQVGTRVASAEFPYRSDNPNNGAFSEYVAKLRPGADARGWEWSGDSQNGSVLRENDLPGIPGNGSGENIRGQGYNTSRIQFHMERLTPSGLCGAINNAYLRTLTAAVNNVTKNGGLETWWKTFAMHLKYNDMVIFDVTSESDATSLLSMASRAAGATQSIFAMGNNDFKTLIDPQNKIIYKMPQHVGSDSSSTSLVQGPADALMETDYTPEGNSGDLLWFLDNGEDQSLTSSAPHGTRTPSAKDDDDGASASSLAGRIFPDGYHNGSTRSFRLQSATFISQEEVTNSVTDTSFGDALGDALDSTEEFVAILQELLSGSHSSVSSSSTESPSIMSDGETSIPSEFICSLGLELCYFRIVNLFNFHLSNIHQYSSQASCQRLAGFVVQEADLQKKILFQVIIHQFEMMERLLGLPVGLRVSGGGDEEEDLRGMLCESWATTTTTNETKMRDEQVQAVRLLRQRIANPRKELQ